MYDVIKLNDYSNNHYRIAIQLLYSLFKKLNLIILAVIVDVLTFYLACFDCPY